MALVEPVSIADSTFEPLRVISAYIYIDVALSRQSCNLGLDGRE